MVYPMHWHEFDNKKALHTQGDMQVKLTEEIEM